MNIHEYTGKDPWGMPDATQCECDCGWKLGGSAKTVCNPPTCDDWDEWKKKAQDLPRLAVDLDLLGVIIPYQYELPRSPGLAESTTEASVCRTL